jgi:heme/copper-type cytochrome/quinol oxidase subunit 4
MFVSIVGCNMSSNIMCALIAYYIFFTVTLSQILLALIQFFSIGCRQSKGVTIKAGIFSHVTFIVIKNVFQIYWTVGNQNNES